MQKLITCALIVLTCSIVLAGEVADEVTFRTAQPAPTDIISWSFFWVMPEIAPDATLEYAVIQPDGEEYFRMAIPAETPSGSPIRSDFREGLAGGNPEVFSGHNIQFTFTVDIGTIQFPDGATFLFEFTEVVEAVR